MILIILDNYIVVDELALEIDETCIREVWANPRILQLPLTPKEIILKHLYFQENEKVLNFTCNGKLNGANRVAIKF
jgi:hypothetical protein